MVSLPMTDRQRESVAKFFWDMSKVGFALLVLGPLAQPEGAPIQRAIFGLAIGLTLGLCGYYIDGRERKA